MTVGRSNGGGAFSRMELVAFEPGIGVHVSAGDYVSVEGELESSEPHRLTLVVVPAEMPELIDGMAEEPLMPLPMPARRRWRLRAAASGDCSFGFNTVRTWSH